jgi:membrane-associated phospholipid phosphatase
MVSLLQLALWQKLEYWDQWLFIQLNNVWTNPVFDSVMPFLRNSKIWAPLYLFVGLFAIFNSKRNGTWWCIFFLVTVALTDMTGTYIFKHNIERMRPCSDPDFFFRVRLLVSNCSPGYGFISNHAANHFGLAAFFFLTMKPVLRRWAAIGFLWAGLIAYAQVYVGVHYPLDVLAGAILGLIFGTVTGTLFNKRYGFAIFGNQPTMSS